METTLTDKEILDAKVGGMFIRDMTAITFINWISQKIDGVDAYRAANQELIQLVSNPPMGRIMPDEEKCRLFRKLQSLLDYPLIK